MLKHENNTQMKLIFKKIQKHSFFFVAVKMQYRKVTYINLNK